MFLFEVGGKKYKVRFGYRVLSKTNLIDKVINITNQKDSEHAFQNMISTVSELLLAGLQKSHSDEFGYESDNEKKEKMEKIYDLLDQYEDEGTKENQQNGYTMFENLQEELMRNGFLSQLSKKLENQKKN